MDANTLYIIIAILAGFIAFVFVLVRIIPRILNDRMDKLSREALEKNNESFLTLARDVLGSEKENIKGEIRTDLSAKKEAISELIQEIRREIKESKDVVTKSDEDRIRSFSALEKELKEYKEITGELKASTDNLKSLLSNNQMRGAFGEQVAEDLLKMAGFVINQDYVSNKKQKSETRPDFTIFLPDATKINIDVKFPYNSLVKYTECEDREEKKRYFKAFEQDIKEKIKQVTTRDYINPEDKTVDFVILFIPNEMIFSFVYEKMPEVWESAMKKKVVMAGPFSFTAILRMVKQAYDNFRYQENLQEIIGLIKKFDEEYEKYSGAVDTLGDRLRSSLKQFEVVESTRNKSLTSIVSKIKIREVEDSESIDLLDQPSDE